MPAPVRDEIGNAWKASAGNPSTFDPNHVRYGDRFLRMHSRPEGILSAVADRLPFVRAVWSSQALCPGRFDRTCRPDREMESS
jgi:hypothetical protein